MILGQGPKVEQFKLIGYTLYKYIWNKIKIKGQEEVYSSLSDDSNNLHLSFQLTH